MIYFSSAIGLIRAIKIDAEILLNLKKALRKNKKRYCYEIH